MSEKAKTQADKVADIVNDFSFSPEEFCKAMSREHRTLQQSFTRLCIHWICTCSEEDYAYDARNEHSHLVSKAIVQSVDADVLGCLPMI